MATRCVISNDGVVTPRARYKTNNDKQAGVTRTRSGAPREYRCAFRSPDSASADFARARPYPISEIVASLFLRLAPAFFFRVLCEDTARFRKNGPAADFGPFAARNHVPRELPPLPSPRFFLLSLFFLFSLILL